MKGEGVDDWRDWHVPGVFPMTVLGLAAERGFEGRALLRSAAIDVSSAEVFEAGLPLGTHLRLMDVVMRTLEDEALGLELGWRLPPTALGNLGMALIASETLADALEVLQRFWHLVARHLHMSVETVNDTGVLEFSLRLPALAAHRGMFIESVQVSIFRGLRAFAPEGSSEAEVWFDFPEPAYAARARELLPAVRYGMPASQFRFPARLLQTPLAMANAVALRSALARCEQEEAERGLTSDQIVGRVRSELRLGPNGYPDLEQMARRLHLTPRTLRRRLHQEGTRYSSLLESVRRQDAIRLLSNQRLEVSEIAEMLGYFDPANFTRAFRRWTGKTPSQYRRMTSQRPG